MCMGPLIVVRTSAGCTAGCTTGCTRLQKSNPIEGRVVVLFVKVHKCQTSRTFVAHSQEPSPSVVSIVRLLKQQQYYYRYSLNIALTLQFSNSATLTNSINVTISSTTTSYFEPLAVPLAAPLAAPNGHHILEGYPLQESIRILEQRAQDLPQSLVKSPYFKEEQKYSIATKVGSGLISDM